MNRKLKQLVADLTREALDESEDARTPVEPADEASSPNGATDYDKVGYGRPPKLTRFPKGVSGNPGGRKKGVKNFSTFVKQALDQTVAVKADGRNRRMSVRRAIA